jgi:hypothetical protein
MAVHDRSAEVEAYIRAQPKALRDILEAARKAVREAAPHATETVKWNVPVYVGNGNILALAAFAEHVNVQFYRGAGLADPEGLLEGAGKHMRHLKLRNARELARPSVKALLRAAVRLDKG